MRKTFLYRIYPNKKQLKALEATLEECRWLYNETLAYRKNAWEERQERVSYYDSKKRIPILKAERPWQKMPLSERVYHCPCCLLEIDRDLNAARNIKAVGLHSVGLPLEAPCL